MRETLFFIPSNTGLIPKPNTGRRLSISNIPMLIKEMIKKIKTVIGNIISNIRAIELIPLIIK